MEESSEAHMETDVSSTTEDVPETQEVTGSNGNVEMVVIVEKVTEEESSTTELDVKEPTVSESEVATSSNTPSPRPSPQKLASQSPRTSPQKPAVQALRSSPQKVAIQLPRPSPQKPVNQSPQKPAIQSPRPSPLKQAPQPPLTSPEKLTSDLKPTQSPNEVSDSPNISLSTEHSYNKSPKEDRTTVALISTSEETVDSSSITEVQKLPEKQVTPLKLSPIKVIDIHKTPKICQVDSKSSPSKEKTPKICQVDSKSSPSKEKPEVPKNSSPVKEINLNQSALNGNVEEPHINREDFNKPKEVPVDIVTEKEQSNESHTDSNLEVTEKEHNKSISRELKSLIKSAKESKIISECTQLTTKTRKSRTPLDVSNSSLNVSVEADKIKDTRRGSDNSQKSGCSEKAEKLPIKRSMRSQNPEFVHKVKQFLNSVTSKVQKESDEGTDDEVDNKNKELPVGKDVKDSKNECSPSLPKKKKVGECVTEGKLRSDSYCWRCHWEVEQANEKTHSPMTCTVCPRTFHYKCLSGAERNKISANKNWVCPECMGVLHAESSETRSPAMKKISLGMLCELLKHAHERMMDLNGVEPFVHPVDRAMFPDYEKYVVHPMDLTLMKDNIAAGLYGSTEAFLADAQWILHNSIIFNTCEQGFVQSKLTAAARTLVRSCRAEMGEIEACPECYAAAHARKPTWFTDVCTTPHMLLWAKLKGFPYWPAKGMSVNNAGMVDVRFFGAHDRAWVPAKDCFLYSERDPNNFRTKRQDILDSMQEAEEHIRNISRKYGKFVYPPFKTQFDPSKLTEQLKMMIPSFEGEVRTPVKEKPNMSPSMVKDKRRSNSKSSKSSLHDGDVSDSEESSPVVPRKMSDGAHIARMDEDEKDKTIEAVPSLKEENEKSEKTEKSSRKRRRSEMEEAAFFTIISSAPKEKKRKNEPKSDENAQDMKAETVSQTSVASSEELEKPKEAVAMEIESPLPKSKDNEPTSSTAPEKEKVKVPEKEKAKEPPKLTPIKLVISTKSNKIVGRKSPFCKTSNTSTPKVLPIKIKPGKVEKTVTITRISRDKDGKEEKTKSHKRRNSKTNKSLNSSTNISDVEKAPEKKADKVETVENKDKKPNESTPAKSKDDTSKEAKTASEKSDTPKPNVESPKSAKERIQFDEDDTSLAVIARGVKGNVNSVTSNSVASNVTNSNVSGLPTISSVRSLSTAPAKTNTAVTRSNSAKTIEVTIEPNGDSLLIPTSSANVSSKTTKGKDEQSMVGRVGVRAFARIASPEPQRSKEVEVEIKAEPIDFDDQDRLTEKLDLFKAFKLRPVSNAVVTPTSNNLREVRINKVVMTPLNARKTATKPPEVRPRARKTFPTPRKPDDGRSELNSKNSMVYIPIQPPTTPGPLRGPRPVIPQIPGSLVGMRQQAPVMSTGVSGNNVVNTMTTPLVQSSISQLSNVTSTSVANTNPLPLVPTIGQVPTTVHTVPLITSVNGQWTFSLQPIMSVGGLDDAPSPPLLNGLPERTTMPPSLLPSTSNIVTPATTGVTMCTTSSLLSVPAGVMLPAPAVSTVPAGPAVPTVPAGTSGTTGQQIAVPTVSTAPLVAGPSATPAVLNRTASESSANPGEPPRLQQRPVLMNPLDSHTPIGNAPTPSTAGPITAKLNQNAVKLTDFFRALLEDSMEKLDEPHCQVTTLKLQLEQANWRHKQELEEMKHNHELMMAEMRSSFEKDKVRLASEMRRAAQIELETAVKAAKSKQWCANCSQEAQFYCCWNTSYCDYPCQRSHWNTHFAVCTQQRADADGSPGEGRLQPPDALPKNATAPSTTPTLTVGGKLAQARVANAEQNQKQSSIIMSMVEDKSGNQTLRCLGTYKAPNAPPTNQIPPIIINKQIMNNEDPTKKVVTSGGYLIVGANNNATVVTPPRRTHSIYYT